MKSLKLAAPAKINLFLKVGPRRRDGYHSLETEFQEISLSDQLEFHVTDSPVLRLSVSGASLPVDSTNLVIRALAALRLRLKVKQGMSVHLHKAIPIGAGLGGGSSDAATALWAGWLLWKQKPKSLYRRRVPPILKELATQLGADVSFFLKGGRALGRGKGEILKPLPQLPSRWMVLVYPQVHVSTAKAYAWLDHDRKKKSKSSETPNDFEASVFRRFPKIARVKKTLERLGCQNVQMSGSGSSVFGYVLRENEGAQLTRSMSRRPWDVFLVHT